MTAPRFPCTLDIDNRERNVLAHTNELSAIAYTRKQLTTGDYVLRHDTHIIAVIERKTLDDYGASIKDGRADNKRKLLALRQRTGCRIYYLIEGPKSPAPSKTFARIPYAIIRRSFMRLTLEHGIILLHTLDTIDTARELVELTLATQTLLETLGDPTWLLQAQVQLPANADADTPADEIASGGEFDLNELTTPVARTDHDIVREMWACFSGITVETADSFIAKWSIADIVRGAIPRAELCAHKLANHRAINLRVVNALQTIGPVMASRLLATIPNISIRTANILLRDRTLASVLCAPVDVIAMYATSPGGIGATTGAHVTRTSARAQAKLGQARAAACMRLFYYTQAETPVTAPVRDTGNTCADIADTPAQPAPAVKPRARTRKPVVNTPIAAANSEIAGDNTARPSANPRARARAARKPVVNTTIAAANSEIASSANEVADVDDPADTARPPATVAKPRQRARAARKPTAIAMDAEIAGNIDEIAVVDAVDAVETQPRPRARAAATMRKRPANGA